RREYINTGVDASFIQRRYPFSQPVEIGLIELGQVELRLAVGRQTWSCAPPRKLAHREVRRLGLRGRQVTELRHFGEPEQREIMPVRLEETDEGVEVHRRTDVSVYAPILQRVPGLRTAQDQGLAACVLEIVGILRYFERSVDCGPHGANLGAIGASA